MMPIRKNYAENWLPSIFNDFFEDDWMPRVKTSSPAVNVSEDDKEYKVEVAAPGMNKEDFNIHLSDDGELVIAMEKKEETKDDNKKYLRREFSYQKFQQALTLPDDVEKESISAQVNDGVLTICLPKKECTEIHREPRVIEIK